VERTETEFSVAQVLRILLDRKWLFLALSVLIFAAVVAYASFAQRQYTASVKVVPRTAESAGGLQSLMGELGGLAALAGVSLGGSNEDKEAYAWLRSRAFTVRFLEQQKLSQELFAEAWDAQRGDWQEGISKTDAPSIDDAYGFFNRKVRRISQDQRTGVISIDVTWTDPVAAARWANLLVDQANRELRGRALAEADASLKFLAAELKNTGVVEMQQSIYRLMESQIKRKLLANSRADYAFSVIDPASPPDVDHFASPKRSLLLMIALPFALVAAAIAVVALGVLRGLIRAARSL
jgi:uncharacterized protein involved in exopolysaccharide biosynthesis